MLNDSDSIKMFKNCSKIQKYHINYTSSFECQIKELNFRLQKYCIPTCFLTPEIFNLISTKVCKQFDHEKNYENIL